MKEPSSILCQFVDSLMLKNHVRIFTLMIQHKTPQHFQMSL